MTGRERAVLDTLEERGPEMPIVVLARATGLRPTELVEVLDGLCDEGHVLPGFEARSVRRVAPAPPAVIASERLVRPAR